MDNKIELYQNFKKKNIHRLIISSPYKNKTITSYGLIVYALDTKRTLLVKRKHTVSFLFIINGYYRDAYLYDYINNITDEESRKLKKCFKSKRYYKYLYKNIGNNVYYFEYSYKKFYKNLYLIENIYNNTIFTNVKLEWNWPKGKINNRETFLDCAKREFKEEIDCDLPEPFAISNEWLKDCFIAIGGKNIESKFIIYIINNEFEVKKPLFHPEVSNRKWFKFEEIKQKKNSNLNFINKIINMIPIEYK